MKTHRAWINGFLFICILLVLGSCSFNNQTQTITSSDNGNPSYINRDPQTNLQEGMRAVTAGDQQRAYELFAAAASGFARDKQANNQCDSLILQAEAGLTLGQLDKAMACLSDAERIALDLKDQQRLGRIYILRGNLHHVAGEFDAAETNLQKALAMAKAEGDSPLLISAWNDLGNLYGTTGQYAKALEAYQASASLGKKNGNPLRSAIALINGAKVCIAAGDQYLKPQDQNRSVAEFEKNAPFEVVEQETSSKSTGTRASILLRAPVATQRPALDRERATAAFAEADAMLHEALSILEGADNSQAKTTAFINIGLAYMDLAERHPEQRVKYQICAEWELSHAVDNAREARDARLLSYAVGHLGRLRRLEGKLPQADQLTEEAIYWATKADVPESLYRWEWQYALILNDQGHLHDAITADQQAITTLESIRAEFANCYGQSRADLRRTESELYQDYVNLLLRYATDSVSTEQQEILKLARQAVEKRKVFELREYFNDDCLGATAMGMTDIDEMLAQAVVIYPILLPDRLEIIASFPYGSIRGEMLTDGARPQTVARHYVSKITAEEVIKETNALRDALEIRTSENYLPHARQLYDWLIRPLEKDLIQAKANTLVFVPDGVLRNVPMGALYDGSAYLIETYAVAVTPGLMLTNPNPLPPEKINILAAGLTEPTQGFEALPGVSEELQAIASLHHTTVLADQQFSHENFAKALRDHRYNVVHIASHGKFSENLEDSFILAADQPLTFNDLSEFIGLYRFREQPLELLTLSACETAAGNEQAALGLAGLAVKVGARSVLATLWAVDDLATAQLVTEFYRQLGQPDVSRALALQKAQLKLLHDPLYEHPGYWSPFILLNNWL